MSYVQFRSIRSQFRSFQCGLVGYRHRFVSDLFMDSTTSLDEYNNPYRIAFQQFAFSLQPDAAAHFQWYLDHYDNPKPGALCPSYTSYGDADKGRADWISGSSNPLTEAHWMPPNTKPAAPQSEGHIVLPSSQTNVSPKDQPKGASSLGAQAPGRQTISATKPTNSPGVCRKATGVRVVAEIRDNPQAGVHDVQLTIANSSSAKVTCEFIAHKNGHWGTPGMQDVDAGQTTTDVVDFGNVSKPVAYRCMLAEDVANMTTCFPTKWWLTIPQTPSR